MENKRNSTLRHYTNVGFLKMILAGDTLKFTNALDQNVVHLWDDQNDVKTLRLFYERKHLNPLVLCFTRTISIHHWEYYGKGTGNDFKETDKVKCCIVFDEKKLTDLINEQINQGKDMKLCRVTYISTTSLKSKYFKINEDELPFIKKYEFRTDREERLVYFVNDDTGKSFFLEGINDCIKYVSLYIKGESAEEIMNNLKNELIGLTNVPLKFGTVKNL